MSIPGIIHGIVLEVSQAGNHGARAGARAAVT